MTRLPLFVLTCVIVFLCTAVAPASQAHSRSQSFSTWSLAENRLVMVFTVKTREVTRLPVLESGLTHLEALLTTHIQKTVRITSSSNVACPPLAVPQALAAADGYLRVRATFVCEVGLPASIGMSSFFAVAPSHVHYARLTTTGELPREFLFTDSRREQNIARLNNNIDGFDSAFLQYLRLGVEHILGGIDHLAFLAALLLLVRNLRELIWIVTGFTLGHSLSLSLAVLGHVSLEVWVVEALIGFTIALVAADNIGLLCSRHGLIAAATVVSLLVVGIASAVLSVGLPLLTLAGLAAFSVAYLSFSANELAVRRRRPALTLAFGIVHGFGFANVLNEIGLPDSRLMVALGGFNIGVEVGQILVVAVLWWLVQWVGRASTIRDYRPGVEIASAGLCGLGVYWFVSRGFVQV